MKKILVISESINVNDSSGSKVNVALINNLFKLGYQVKVLHYSRKNIFLENIECVDINEIKFSLNYFLSRMQRVFSRIFKVDLSYFLENRFGHSFTFFNDSKSISKAVKKHYSNEDLIITLSKGASFRPHYAMLKLPSLHDKWLAYVHDPYPFHYYPEPYNWVEKGHNFKEKFFREVSEKAKYSAFPSLLLKEWMGNYFPNFLKTGIIIPHQVEGVSIKTTINIPDYFSEKKFTLLHAGNLMMPRNPKGLINGYSLFLSRNNDAIKDTLLLFVGPAEYYKKYLSKLNKPNVFWNGGYEDFEKVKSMQKKTSVNIILEAKSDISPFLPGKFSECVKVDNPILVLGPDKSESKRLLGKDYEFMAENNDDEKISILIEKLYFNWKSNKSISLNRPDLLKYLGIENLKITMQELLNES